MNSSIEPGMSGLRGLAPDEDAESISVAGQSLIQSATMEFHASLHLLADRARSLTGAAGAAIAFDQDGEFFYSVSSGKSVPDCGATVDPGNPNISACIETRRPARNANGMAVPVIRQGRVAGFVELTEIHGGAQENAQDDALEAVSRLAEMVNTALDHFEAAEHAAKRMDNPKLEAESGLAAPVLLPTRSLAAKPVSSPVVSSSPTPVSGVHACKSCGFPVSPGRVLCVDCEEHPERVTANPGDGLFQIKAQESWISTYGYTIASLLITALVAAIILWLR